MRPNPGLVLFAFALGCAVHTTEPRPETLQMHYSIAAVQAALPNVVRYQNEFVFLILDRKSDLLAIAGLPDHPKDVIECGGAEELHFEIADFQQVGVQQEVVKMLATGSDYNLDVYQLSSFAGVCESDAIAHGTGRVRYNDNDVFQTSGRTDTFGFWMEGPVSLTAGGTAKLLGHVVFQRVPEELFPREIVSSVALSGR